MTILSLSSAAGGVVLPLLVDLVMRVWHWRVAWVMLGLGVHLCLRLHILPSVLKYVSTGLDVVLLTLLLMAADGRGVFDMFDIPSRRRPACGI